MRLHQHPICLWSDPRRARRKALPTVDALEGRALLAQVTVIPGMGALVNPSLGNLPLSNLPLQSTGTNPTTTPGSGTPIRLSSGGRGSASMTSSRSGGSSGVAFPVPNPFPGSEGAFLPPGAPSTVQTTRLRLHGVSRGSPSPAGTTTGMPTPPPAAPLAVGGHHGHHHHHHHH